MEFNSFKDWVEKLINVSKEENTYVVVEGKNDIRRLKLYGVESIYPIKGKKFYDVVEDLEFANLCILLTDLDKQGEKIFLNLKSLLQREGIPVDVSFREYLKNFPYEEIEKLPDIKETLL